MPLGSPGVSMQYILHDPPRTQVLLHRLHVLHVLNDTQLHGILPWADINSNGNIFLWANIWEKVHSPCSLFTSNRGKFLQPLKASWGL